MAFPVAGPVLQPAVAVDGKAERGAIGSDGLIPYLLAAATHGESVVLAERLVGAKTNEVPEFQPLLRQAQAELAGHVFTMDAAHRQAHAWFLVEDLAAHYAMIVKENHCAARRSSYTRLSWEGFEERSLGSDGLPGAEMRWEQ